MMPDYNHAGVQLYVGDCRAVLAELPAESVQMCVTSPPYWGLRDYGTDRQIWDGDPDCTHGWNEELHLDVRGSGTDDGATGRQRGEGYGRNAGRGQFCRNCGAWYGSLGLEPTPALYVAHLATIFDAVRRVLRKDGTLWLNLGDSYAAQRSATAMPAQTVAGGIGGKGDAAAYRGMTKDYSPHLDAASFGLKHKDLIGIPWRVAFALQEHGWYLRSDIIWAKPNQMPESVQDRPTRAHEYLFLLAKSERYFYNAAAIAEPSTSDHGNGNGYARSEQISRNNRGQLQGWRVSATRTKRSVWTVNTKPFPEAHFATYPPKLIAPCILAGSRPGDTVLDPFSGAGTTALVAKQLGRQAIGIELSPAYHALATRRLTQDVLPLDVA
jgi:DNA modification methylase